MKRVNGLRGFAKFPRFQRKGLIWKEDRSVPEPVMRAKALTLGILLLSLTVGAAFPFAYGETSPAFSFNLPPSSLVDCWFSGVTFQATQGQAITVQWSENLSSAGPISMDFYIVPASSFRQHWFCDEGPAYVYWNDGAYGIANWVAPWTGGYAAILVNYGSYSVSGTMSVTTPNATVSANPLGLSTVRRTCYSNACLRT